MIELLLKINEGKIFIIISINIKIKWIIIEEDRINNIFKMI